jgi:hypothetical protein
MDERKVSGSRETALKEGNSSTECLIELNDTPCSHGEEGDGRFVVNPHFDSRLLTEMKWHSDVLARFLPEAEIQPLTFEIIERVICEGLMSLGMVVQHLTVEGTTLKLDTSYKRCGELVVLFFSMHEVVSDRLAKGLELDRCLDAAFETNNLRPVEPTPREVKPLVRKAQRMFPVSLVRKLPLDLFWFLSMPRLVEDGLIERTPHNNPYH